MVETEEVSAAEATVNHVQTLLLCQERYSPSKVLMILKRFLTKFC
jgi:hypothetical protein